MCKITIGAKVQFDLFQEMGGSGGRELSQTVTGTVVMVHEAHGWFSVAYGDGQRTTTF